MKVKDRARPKIPPVEPGVYVAVCVYSIDLQRWRNDTILPTAATSTSGRCKPDALGRESLEPQNLRATA